MERKGAEVVTLRAQTQCRNGLTIQDRIHALTWHASGNEANGLRLAIHAREGDTPESSDFVSIYKPDQRFAAFTAARAGGTIHVWRSATGRAIGRFKTMREALAAVSAERAERLS